MRSITGYHFWIFEARAAILKLLDQAVNDTNAQVRVTVYDLNEPEIVKRLVKLKTWLKIIIDDSGSHGDPDYASGFAATGSAHWNDLHLPNVKAKIGFSPHNADNALLQDIAKDIAQTTSTLLYSLAFLYQTPGVIINSIKKETEDHNIFVYGISDKSVGGLDLQKPDGDPPVVFPARLLTNLPEPFKTEASDGGGIRMHHKFVVIDFDKPTARVYMGSYNFSSAADLHNGENLLLIQDRRVAVSYMIEALAMFDHYEFRDVQQKSAAADHKLYLQLPPAKPGELPWWSGSYTNPQKIRDRELFSKK
ncbi:phosphatidylserine/phosphatidylglycerophosphate/cardiolipin synthase-like enzyme [Pedobacter cryoconitis]|uniref:Phosphatidylserine/phosphatidylglycerophosphate/ cardiolipin synthase-like enzyme n=1 Tax=Pedobacter cryoconitis TaxID=188932 RepID=A0A7W9E0P2_9SPHI|nr:phospholipase D-like domain-containing protein [Pedobacter cryoconitis]MBB5638271.1 phosphatidylserine/phosphatidylglycerophosphate/cardiolipin synthase-like enzyme [Pedobacter cryoconitis]